MLAAVKKYDLRLRPQCPEALEAGHQPAGSEHRWCSDTHSISAHRPAEALDGLADTGKDVLEPLLKLSPVCGKPHAAAVADEEGHADALLEALELAANGAGCDAELSGCGRYRERVSDGVEGLEGIERGRGCHEHVPVVEF